MNTEKLFSFLKNALPLWIIVILLIMMNLLLWDISQRVGQDYNREKNTMPTGLYNAIRSITPDVPNYQEDLKEIKDAVESINGRVGSIELKVRDIWLHY